MSLTNIDLTSPNTSITNVTKCIFKYIITHPLVINPPVYHPLTKEKVEIHNYRLYDGINFSKGLTCSIFPTANKTITYEPYDLGQEGIDKVTYYISIKFYYNELSYKRKEVEEGITNTYKEAVINPEDPLYANVIEKQILLTTQTEKNVNLEIDPGIEIIGNYIEIFRLILNDPIHKSIFPMQVSSFESIEAVLDTGRWEEKEKIYFQEGTLHMRLDAYVSRGWRNRFVEPLKDLNIRIN